MRGPEVVAGAVEEDDGRRHETRIPDRRVDPVDARDLLDHSCEGADREGEQSLTKRERQVLALVGGGLSNDEIGAELHLSPATARTHVSHAMAKLGVRDRAQLVVVAYETGLVQPGS